MARDQGWSQSLYEMKVNTGAIQPAALAVAVENDVNFARDILHISIRTQPDWQNAKRWPAPGLQ